MRLSLARGSPGCMRYTACVTSACGYAPSTAPADVGGTWWWKSLSRLPGSTFRVHRTTRIPFPKNYSTNGNWEERQPTQAEVLSYLGYVADKFELRPDIQLETWITGATFDESTARWIVENQSRRNVGHTVFDLRDRDVYPMPTKPKHPRYR